MKTKNNFLSFLRILLLIIVCIALTIAIVFPLWKFATSTPKLYTIVVLVLCLLYLGFVIVRKCRARIKAGKADEK